MENGKQNWNKNWVQWTLYLTFFLNFLWSILWKLDFISGTIKHYFVLLDLNFLLMKIMRFFSRFFNFLFNFSLLIFFNSFFKFFLFKTFLFYFCIIFRNFFKVLKIFPVILESPYPRFLTYRKSFPSSLRNSISQNQLENQTKHLKNLIQTTSNIKKHTTIENETLNNAEINRSRCKNANKKPHKNNFRNNNNNLKIKIY